MENAKVWYLGYINRVFYVLLCVLLGSYLMQLIPVVWLYSVYPPIKYFAWDSTVSDSCVGFSWWDAAYCQCQSVWINILSLSAENSKALCAGHEQKPSLLWVSRCRITETDSLNCVQTESCLCFFLFNIKYLIYLELLPQTASFNRFYFLHSSSNNHCYNI